MKLLHIDSSIQGEFSVSREVSAAVVAQLAAREPALSVTHHDLAAAPVGHLTLGDMGSDEGQAILAEFLDADIVVIGAGLYNFTIPSQLKAWIDRILVAGETFRYGANGPEGLAGGKRVIIALAKGGVYSPGGPFEGLDFAEPYLRAVFGFIGIQPEVIVAEGIKMSDDHRAAAIAGALDSARDLGVLAAA